MRVTSSGNPFHSICPIPPAAPVIKTVMFVLNEECMHCLGLGGKFVGYRGDTMGRGPVR